MQSLWRFGFPGVRLATGLCALLALLAALTLPVGAHGQPPPIDPATEWKSQGPSPAVGGQSENVTPNDEVVGAIHTVLAHPTDPKTVYIGAVNGGIWKTKNAQSNNPNWKALTDLLPSSAIGAMEFDPTDASANTIVAGVGRYSSFGRLGGNRVGLFKTTNGGDSWTVITGGGTLVGRNISGVAPRGSIIVVSVDNADVALVVNTGIFRSTDGGATFTQISNGNGAATGLPNGVTHDLAGDAANPHRLFTSAINATPFGGVNGVYRSLDTGATWTKVSNAAMDALLPNNTTNVEFAVGKNNNVYCAIANAGRLAGLFRSGDGGTTWTAMDRPRTGPLNVGIHPGGQASIHMSIVADPVNHNIVYIGGDRQPFRAEEGLGPPQFPNSIGAQNFSGRLFRCDASLPALSQCTPLTHIGTASNSSPHADSREMVFDADGNLIETDDGGIYKRINPSSTTGDWISIIGNLAVSEQHDLSYDPLAQVTFVGTQDNDDPHQDKPNPNWFVLLSGDGGDTAVDNQSLGPAASTRYDSAQGLQAFVRTFWDVGNDLLGFVFPPLTPTAGSPPFQGQFVTPVEVNAVTPTRLILGGANGVYETFDQGDTITRITNPPLVINGGGVDAVSYGGLGNAELLVIGVGARVFLRTAAHPAPLTEVVTYPDRLSAFTVRDIVIDPANANAFYLTNAQRVWQTLDGGATWTDVSGNILSFPQIALRAIDYIPRADGSGSNDALVVSSFTGVYVAYESTGFTVWSPLGTGLPNVGFLDLHYVAADDVLVAGSLGRGAWKLKLED